MKIKTVNVRPPIPTRKDDWCAYFDGQEEDGPYGWGETEEEAISDLHATQEMDSARRSANRRKSGKRR